MLLKLWCFVFITVCVNGSFDVYYIDPVIDMLLNGEDIVDSVEVHDDDEPVLSGGVWKCGNCTNLDKSKVVYSETNAVDDNTMTDASLDIQVGFSVPGMRCITVQSDAAKLVRRVSGSCTSGTLTLSIAPTTQFTVQIYN